MSIVIRFGKQDLTYGLEAAWISHGLGLIWFLVDVISKVHDYGTTIYRQPVNNYIKRASIRNFLNFLLASTINLQLHLWDYNHTFNSLMHKTEFYVYGNYVVYLHVYHVRSCYPTPAYKQPLYGCQPDEPQASLATTNRYNHVYIVMFLYCYSCMLQYIVCTLLGIKLLLLLNIYRPVLIKPLTYENVSGIMGLS